MKRSLAHPWPVYDERERQALIEVLESRKWGRSGLDYYSDGDSVIERLWVMGDRLWRAARGAKR